MRPFGCSLLVAGFDEAGPQLYQVDPSGTYFAWKASAIGKNATNAKTFLEKRYSEEMELEDAIHTAILTLKEGFEGQISGSNVEIGALGGDDRLAVCARLTPAGALAAGIVGKDRTFRVLSAAEVNDYLQETA